MSQEEKSNQQIDKMKVNMNNCIKQDYSIGVQVQVSKQITDLCTVGATITANKEKCELEANVKKESEEENKDIEVTAVVNTAKEYDIKNTFTQKDNIYGDWEVQRSHTLSLNKNYPEFQTSFSKQVDRYNFDQNANLNRTQFDLSILAEAKINQNTSFNASIGMNQDCQLHLGTALCLNKKRDSYMVGLNASCYDKSIQASWQHQTSNKSHIKISGSYSRSKGPQASVEFTIL